jgi:superfamily II DNA or RNA helicase
MAGPSLFAPSPAYAVRLNDELRRVENIPRRQWSEEEAKDMAEQLTELLKTHRGTMSLRPVQATALAEIGMRGGLFGIIRVGAGKTIISLLSASVAEAKRPVLLIPAKLVEKTQRDMEALSRHWQIQKTRIITYEWLGRAQAADALDSYKPDVIVCDEAHKLKNKSAAVTRRVARYMKANPTTKMIVMSGTITKRSLHDYVHLIAPCSVQPRREPDVADESSRVGTPRLSASTH